MLVDDGERDPHVMSDALRRLPSQPTPSETMESGLLDGLEEVNRLAQNWLYERGPTAKVAVLLREA